MPHKSFGPAKMLKTVLSWLKQNSAVLRSSGFRFRLVFLSKRRRRYQLFRRFFLLGGILTQPFRKGNHCDFFTITAFNIAHSRHFIPRNIVIIEFLSLHNRHLYPFRDRISSFFGFFSLSCYVNFVLRVQFPLHSR